MSNKKSTKRSLVFSVVALLLCMTMFVGTTFAWFTDSVTSGKNQIVAGNLDVEFEYYTANGWENVEGKTDLVDPEALWEPGHAEVVYLKVTNAGTLALKYHLALTIFNEVQGLTKDGKVINLSEHLRYDVIEGVEPEAYATREEAIAAATSAKKLDNLSQVGELLPEAEETFALVIWMPTTVGNEANHNGVNVPSVELGVSVVATQFTYEEDGFDKYYDTEAFIPVANVNDADITDISATLGMGGADYPMTLDAAFSFKTTESYEEAQAGGYRYWHADFVVSVDQDVAPMGVALAGYYAAYCEGYNDGKWVALASDATITAGTEIRLLDLMLGGGSMSYQELCNWVPEFLCGVADLDSNNAGTTLTVELRLYEVEENTASTADETGKYVTVGTYTYTFPEYVSTAAELEAALENGGNVVLTDDVALTSDTTVINESATIDLGSNVLSSTGRAQNEENTTAADISTLVIGKGVDVVLNAEAGGVVNEEFGYGITLGGGTLTVNGGTYTAGGATAIQVSTGTLIINGGFFDLTGEKTWDYKYLINCIDANYKNGTAKIVINGGTFVGFDPSNNPEGEGTSYVAEGYTVISETQENGDIWYTVVPE